MNSIHEINVSEYRYELPQERIALFPVLCRDTAKLLVAKGNCLSDVVFSSITEHLPENSLLVFNNSKVVNARLLFTKATGAVIEVMLIDPAYPAEHALNLGSTETCRWNCMIGNAKRWKNDALGMSIRVDGKEELLKAVLIDRKDAVGLVEFSWTGGLSFSEILNHAGRVPLPPYIRREAVSSDSENYQTIYSEHEGSVAAPTAGLHFSTALLDRIKNAGIKTATVTLHVGAGTFRPVTAETASGHEMHTESFSIPKESLTVLAEHEGPVIPVGTTSVRTLESLYYIGNSGKKGNVGQWDVYRPGDYVSRSEAMERLVTSTERILHGSTSMMIVPGYRFRMADAMITNFHQPGSTLLMLVAAFYGERWKELYNHALREDYRFLSYGDGMLLFP